MKSVYKNQEGQKKVYDFYDKALNSLGVLYEEKNIKTEYGMTHILIVGDKAKKPIFTLHGGNGINPLNLKLFLPLLDKYCIYAPDVIGMPGKSEPFRNLNPNRDDYGLWINELLEKLNIERIPFVASSYSSAMTLSLAKIFPERIEKAVLLNPSGIAHGKIMPMMTEMVFPFMTYELHPTRERLIKTFSSMVTEPDEDWYEFFDILLTCYKMEMRAPREYKLKDMHNFKAPVCIIASNEDIFFPANKVFSNAEKMFLENEKKLCTIDGKHLPCKKTMEKVCNEIRNFL